MFFTNLNGWDYNGIVVFSRYGSIVVVTPENLIALVSPISEDDLPVIFPKLTECDSLQGIKKLYHIRFVDSWPLEHVTLAKEAVEAFVKSPRSVVVETHQSLEFQVTFAHLKKHGEEEIPLKLEFKDETANGRIFSRTSGFTEAQWAATYRDHIELEVNALHLGSEVLDFATQHQLGSRWDNSNFHTFKSAASAAKRRKERANKS
jgi:hypothetical protein